MSQRRCGVMFSVFIRHSTSGFSLLGFHLQVIEVIHFSNLLLISTVTLPFILLNIRFHFRYTCTHPRPNEAPPLLEMELGNWKWSREGKKGLEKDLLGDENILRCGWTLHISCQSSSLVLSFSLRIV